MKKFNGKIFVGAALALSLGGFTIPASASVPPPQSAKYVGKNVGGIQLAQVARDIDEKTDEIHNGATGAVNAVDAAHRRHERNEYRHHTVEGKVDSKVNEVGAETRGAGRAVERAHRQHEAVERSEGRD
jgi:hypothetical protein